jgi:ABC-type dipeptide/oligopeptide/nickel transport system permease subunit
MTAAPSSPPAPAAPRRGRPRWPGLLAHDWGGRIGAALLLILVVTALAGPLLAPHSATETIGIPGSPSGPGAPLGLDFLGRDVLSRTLYGGRSTLLLGGAATLLTYLIGVIAGLAAGYSRSLIDPVIMRGVDVVLSFPALLVMLLAVTAFGGGPVVLLCSAALVLFPGVARIVRTATAEVATRAYVEAAVARGERPAAIVRREILPNIVAPLVADLGIRFSWSIILIASVNFLGLGLRPPTADWGLMVSENRSIFATNSLAVLAPAAMLALLIIGVNLVGDAYVRRLGRSGGRS